MNRRSFFNTIARVAAAASLSPTIFIPKFEPVKWKVIRASWVVTYPFEPMLFFGEWKWIYSGEPFADNLGSVTSNFASVTNRIIVRAT